MSEIGFIGLGRMGARMAARLMDAGHVLTLFDVDPATTEPLVTRGAKRAATPAAVGDAADLVFASVPSPAIVRDVAFAVAGGKKVKTFVDLSTTGSRVAGEIATALAAKNIASLDAPVSGGVRGAEQGTLSVMVSGPRAAFEAAEPVLKIFGRLFFMGETPGLGQTMKLVNNLLGACAIAITGEGMAMGIKAGLDPKLMIDVLNVSTGRNGATQDKWPRAILPRTFDAGFATALSLKDTRLCLEEAEAMGVETIVGDVVRQVLEATNETYGPDSDFTMMAKLIEERAGLDLPIITKEGRKS